MIHLGNPGRPVYPPRDADEAALVEVARDYGPTKVILFRDEHERLCFTCPIPAVTFMVGNRLARRFLHIAHLERLLTTER